MNTYEISHVYTVGKILSNYNIKQVSEEQRNLPTYIDEPTVYDIFHQNPRWPSFGTVTSEPLVKQFLGINTFFALCL